MSWLANRYSSYLTVLATLSMCTDSIPLQGAGSSIAAGIHTFLQMEKERKKRASRVTECKWVGGDKSKEELTRLKEIIFHLRANAQT